MRPHSLFFCLLCVIILLIAVTSVTPIGLSQPSGLILSIMTQKSTYFLEGSVLINGTLSYANGTRISNGLVAIEVDNPSNSCVTIRTVPTSNGTIPEGIINVESVFLSDWLGNPVNSTRASDSDVSYLNVTIRNKGTQNKNVLVSVNIFDQSYFTIFSLWVNWSVAANSVLKWVTGFPVPLWVTGGNATIYASVLTNFPRMNGTPYGPEKSSHFLITGAVGFINPLIEEPSYNGTFSIAFRMPLIAGIGNFTVYASADYLGETITNKATFTAKLEGDSNNDGRVNYIDLGNLAIAYGSSVGQAAYNLAVDFNSDGRVNYVDLGKVAVNYGKKTG